ncbi:MAG: ribosome biogenesis GTP-binding protein YihA/YsxC [Alphaproteobacteria bacterium]
MTAKTPAWLFAQKCDFFYGAYKPGDFPPEDLPEVAFAGRSNVGKSSLINSLVGRKNLVRTSKTPGRTQQINFFRLADHLNLIDLPGYGYAKASKSSIANWTQVIHSYLSDRGNLRRVFVLMDSRHGPKKVDHEILNDLNHMGVPCQIILTKIDKTPKKDLDKLLENLPKELEQYAVVHPDYLCCSSEKSIGIQEIRSVIAEFASLC